MVVALSEIGPVSVDEGCGVEEYVRILYRMFEFIGMTPQPQQKRAIDKYLADMRALRKQPAKIAVGGLL